MSKNKPYYYRKGLLENGCVPICNICPFADKCGKECSYKTSGVSVVGFQCAEATRLNREYRAEPPKNPTVQDKRGRTWERFSDEMYFDSISIRCLDAPDARDFNAPMNFSFFSLKDADAFWEMLPRLA